jgi:curved DNA-binding protein CbpA
MSKIYTHYQKLNVPQDATDEQIESAYDLLIKKYDPEKFEGDKKAKAIRIIKMATISYETLIDPEKRTSHDKWIKNQESDLANVEKTISDAVKTVGDKFDGIKDSVKEKINSFEQNDVNNPKHESPKKLYKIIAIAVAVIATVSIGTYFFTVKSENSHSQSISDLKQSEEAPEDSSQVASKDSEEIASYDKSQPEPEPEPEEYAPYPDRPATISEAVCKNNVLRLSQIFIYRQQNVPIQSAKEMFYSEDNRQVARLFVQATVDLYADVEQAKRYINSGKLFKECLKLHRGY